MYANDEQQPRSVTASKIRAELNSRVDKYHAHIDERGMMQISDDATDIDMLDIGTAIRDWEVESVLYRKMAWGAWYTTIGSGKHGDKMRYLRTIWPHDALKYQSQTLRTCGMVYLRWFDNGIQFESNGNPKSWDWHRYHWPNGSETRRSYTMVPTHFKDKVVAAARSFVETGTVEDMDRLREVVKEYERLNGTETRCPDRELPQG